MAKKKTTPKKTIEKKSVKKKNLSVVDVKLQKIADYAGIEFDEIKKTYKKKFAKEKEENKNNWGDDILQQRVLIKLKNKYKRQKMTELYTVKGKIFSVSRIRDINSTLRKDTLEKFEETGDIKYILTKKVREDDSSVSVVPVLDEETDNIIPIDYRKDIDKKDGTSFKNKNYNKIIQPNNVQNVYGIYNVFNTSDEHLGVYFCNLVIRGDSCSLDIPTNQPVEFKAVFDKDSSTDIFLTLKSASSTEIKVIEKDGIENIDKLIKKTEYPNIKTEKELKEEKEILEKKSEKEIEEYKKIYTENENEKYKMFRGCVISQLFECSEKHKELYGEYNKLITILRGNVIQVYPENQNGNKVIVIDDDSVEDGNYIYKDTVVTEIRCIVPSFIPIDFDVNSIVMITGNLYQPEEDNFPLFMTNGIYAIPEFKQELKETEDLNFNDDEVDEELEDDNEEVESDEVEDLEISLEDLKGDDF